MERRKGNERRKKYRSIKYLVDKNASHQLLWIPKESTKCIVEAQLFLCQDQKKEIILQCVLYKTTSLSYSEIKL